GFPAADPTTVADAADAAIPAAATRNIRRSLFTCSWFDMGCSDASVQRHECAPRLRLAPGVRQPARRDVVEEGRWRVDVDGEQAAVESFARHDEVPESKRYAAATPRPLARRRACRV